MHLVPSHTIKTGNKHIVQKLDSKDGRKSQVFSHKDDPVMNLFFLYRTTTCKVSCQQTKTDYHTVLQVKSSKMVGKLGQAGFLRGAAVLLLPALQKASCIINHWLRTPANLHKACIVFFAICYG